MVTVDNIKAHYKLDKLDNTRDADKPFTAAMSTQADRKLDKPMFDTLNAIPGLPVYDSGGIAFLPSLSLCEIDGLGKISKLTDAASGVELMQTDVARQPELKVDGLGREYIRFERSARTQLAKTNMKINQLGGATGKTTTIMFVADTDGLAQQKHFEWLVTSGGNSSHKITGYLPWDNSHVYFDYGTSSSGGRVSVSVSNATNRICTYLYERNDTTAKIYKDGVLLKTLSGLTSSLSSDVDGTFTLAADNMSNNRHTTMDFYAMFIYPRVLTDEEKARMFLYTSKYFGQIPTGA